MTASFQFGTFACSWKEAFFLSKQSLAIVNTKPIVPGHCLVLSRRVVPRLTDLLPEEAADLWRSVHIVAPKLQAHFGGQALTIAVQDGAAAGQTVPHVHVHILPRKSGDFPRNDDVYTALDIPDEDRKPRTLEEMATESFALRPLFYDTSEVIPE